MNKPGKITRPEVMNYRDMVNFIEKKYKIEIRDYHKTYSKDNEDYEDYMDYWHWLCDYFCEVNNGGTNYWGLKEIIEEEDNPKWIKEITQLFYNEFKDELDEDGGVEVLISW